MFQDTFTSNSRIAGPARGWRGLALLFGWLAVGASLVEAAPAPPSELPEYQLKAGFIYNFAKFIQWPETNFAQTNSPLVIGVIGADPFGDELRRIVEGKLVQGRPIQLRHYDSGAEVSGCHVLFVSRSESDRVPDLLARLRGRAILTVADMEKFGQRGGMINLVLVGRSVRFEINLREAEEAGLKISSKLGGLGIPVKTDPTAKGGAP